MNNKKDSMTLQQIRLLLDQLENSGETSTAGTACMDETLSERLLHMSCDRYWFYDPATNIVEIYFTHPAKGRASHISRSLSILLSKVDAGSRRKVASAFEKLINKTSDSETFEYFEVKDDVTIGYNVKACVSTACGENIKIAGVSHIITEIQQSIDLVMQAQQKFELLMGLSSMYIWEYDVKKKCFNANRSLCEKLGLEEKRYSVDELTTHLQIVEMERFLEILKAKQLREKAIIHIKSRQNSFEYIFESDFKPILDRYGEYALLLGTMNDITEHEMLKTMASKDTLTGCYNRNMADVTLDTCFKMFMEKGESYTIIFFDIDHFKSVNDRYGHDAGDYVLTSICNHIVEEIRSNDMMFRWGGDEFLLICRGIAKENIYGYIDRLRKNIEFSKFEFNGNKLQLTISIGAAIFYKSDHDYNAAMKRADRSLYKAKLAGRNKVAILK